MIDPHRYDISVRRRDVEGEVLFEASVVELPDVSAYADTYQEAYDLVIASIRDLSAHAEKTGSPFPQPRDDRDDEFSGRVTLRLPKRVHRLAATAAKVQGVSLNQYLSTVIANDVTRKDTLYEIQKCAVNLRDMWGVPRWGGSYVETPQKGCYVVVTSGSSVAATEAQATAGSTFDAPAQPYVPSALISNQRKYA